ncbi:PAS domain-containing protein [Streptomyces sp. ICN441]|uniref:SpoIIE family protein phosphatase n=1 Tax=Streptomyces sp. ICN441 TaxID=2558286 RepID=UPI001069F4BD|nr:SpoIIE family protein phosphatase [Streptomyces sp. ICN441]TFE43290.1 PAS domain-containing protein [Streptomyces sp. ICN441]
MERLPTSPGEHPGTAQPSPVPADGRPDPAHPSGTAPGDRPGTAGPGPGRPLPPAATAVISEQGVVTGWSEGARRLLGYAPADVMGRPATGLLAQGAAPVAPAAAASPQDLSGTLALRHRDGHDLALPLTATRRTTTSGITEWLVTTASGDAAASEDAGATEAAEASGEAEANEAAAASGEAEAAAVPGDAAAYGEAAPAAATPPQDGAPGAPAPDGPAPAVAAAAAAAGDDGTPAAGPSDRGAPPGGPAGGDPADGGPPGVAPGAAQRAPEHPAGAEAAGGHPAGGEAAGGHPAGAEAAGGDAAGAAPYAGPPTDGPPAAGTAAAAPSHPGPRAGGAPPIGSATDEALAARAFAQSPCMFAVFDADLRLLRANAAMEHVLSLPEARMRGLRLTEFLPDPVSEETERTMSLVLRTGRPQQAPTALRPTGGSAEAGRPATVTPLRDDDGGIRAVCLAAHARTEEPEHHLTRQRMLLEDPGAGIGTTLDLERTAQELTDAAVPRLADSAAVDLCETPRHSRPTGPLPLRRTAYRSHPPGTGPPAGPDPVTHPAHSPLTLCLTTGRSAVYRMDDPSLAQWRAGDPAAARLDRAGTHTLMAVPLLMAGSTLGVALFTRDRNPHPFTPDDLQLAEQLTHRAATGIHNARRFTRERTTTMTLQRSLLPHTLPEQPALDIATRYLPAGSEAGVGGDWFDVIPLSGARVALVVGDVVGHGIRASATMGRLRTAVRTLADVDLPPDELLTRLDDLVLHLSTDESSTSADATTGIGTTCLYAIYDPISRELTHARAGHPPPAAATPDGGVYFLDTPAGPPLGLGGLPFETSTTTLAEGTLLAFYTNGLLNPRETDIDQTLDTLFTALAHPSSGLEATCDRILTTLLTHPPTDDIALLIARTRTLHPHHVATWALPHDPAVVTEARRRTTEQLTGWGLAEAAFITELIVSELVTNAIRYGKPPIRLRLIHTDTTLTTEVTDHSSTSPHLRHAHTYDENGRGLYLIAQLTQRWGTRHTPTSKTIWTEQTLL